MSEFSAIEMKKENIENENNKNKSKKTDWQNIGKSILTNKIYTILIGFVGSNFI
jgi:FtsZ-binding cell division protein ZapB